MSAGVVPDALSPMIDEAIKQKKGLPPKKVAEKLANDPESLPQMLDMMNRVVVYAVIEPRLENVPGCGRVISEEDICEKSPTDEIHKRGKKGSHVFVEQPRDTALFYVDEVALDDRIFIMNFAVGGTRDLARFRREHRESVAGLADGEDV